MATITRRDLIKAAAVTMGAVSLPGWMPRLAFANPETGVPGDVLVCIFMRGGVDGLNVIVPHGEPGGYYYSNRPTIAIPQPHVGQAGTAIDLDGFFGFNPALQPLKDVFDAKALAVVHAAGSPDPSHSHFDAMDYMERGTPGQKQIPTGWIGRHLMSENNSNTSPFRAVGFGSVLQASLRGPVPAQALQSIADFHLKGRKDEITKVQTALASLYGATDLLGTTAHDTFDAMNMLTQINPDTYQPAHGAVYPTSGYGLGLKQVAMLIKADVGLEVACVDIGGWDTHQAEGGTDGQIFRLLTEFSSGLAAFYNDMQDYMGKITLVTMSEFGRRVLENGSHGTDHGHGNFMFVMGGGINGGKVYADWPGLAPAQLAAPGDLQVTTDFRDVLGEIVQQRLVNNQLSQVFPNYPNFNMRGICKPQTQAQKLSFTLPKVMGLAAAP